MPDVLALQALTPQLALCIFTGRQCSFLVHLKNAHLLGKRKNTISKVSIAVCRYMGLFLVKK
jgi:hypothetical protein